VALVVIAKPLCSVLYQRGAFTAADTSATALVLAIYGVGLPAFVLHKVLQPLFYAREDSRSPFIYAIASMITNAVMAVGLMPYIGFSAAAWATTLSGWVMVWQLWRGSRRMGEEAHFDARFRQRMPRIVIASALMGAVLYGASWAMEPLLQLHLWRYLALLALCGLGIVSYFGTGAAIGAFRLSDFTALRGRRAAPAVES
jgi:putative peptidoglycan lipid II flippase